MSSKKKKKKESLDDEIGTLKKQIAKYDKALDTAIESEERKAIFAAITATTNHLSGLEARADRAAQQSNFDHPFFDTRIFIFLL
jgi:hypothetical protein